MVVSEIAILDGVGGWVADHPWLMGGIGTISLLTFFGSLVAVPWLVVRLPEDYFQTRERRSWAVVSGHPIVHWVTLVLKNVLGLVLVVAGIGMLVLPGQGVLTIVVGLVLLDFPGKYRLERYVVTRPAILRGLNWLRSRRGRPPLRM